VDDQCDKLAVDRRGYNKLGDRSFSAACPRLWNDLPPGLRRPGLTFDSFRQSLQTHCVATEALSDSFEFIGAIEISLSVCLSVCCQLGAESEDIFMTEFERQVPA